MATSDSSHTTPPPTKNRLVDIAKSYDPWPLGTDAMIRILAWPDYDAPEQIQKVLQAASHLFGHDDACLCLRHDATIDPPVTQVIENINIQLKERREVKDLGQDMNILIIDDEIPNHQWYRVGLTAFCAVCTDTSEQSVRNQFIQAQHCKKINV